MRKKTLFYRQIFGLIQTLWFRESYWAIFSICCHIHKIHSFFHYYYISIPKLTRKAPSKEEKFEIDFTFRFFIWSIWKLNSAAVLWKSIQFHFGFMYIWGESVNPPPKDNKTDWKCRKKIFTILMIKSYKGKQFCIQMVLLNFRQKVSIRKRIEQEKHCSDKWIENEGINPNSLDITAHWKRMLVEKRILPLRWIGIPPSNVQALWRKSEQITCWERWRKNILSAIYKWLMKVNQIATIFHVFWGELFPEPK